MNGTNADTDTVSTTPSAHGRWFEGINPPSRSCVAVPLPVGCWVELDLVAVRGSGAALLREGSACERRQVTLTRVEKYTKLLLGRHKTCADAVSNHVTLRWVDNNVSPSPCTVWFVALAPPLVWVYVNRLYTVYSCSIVDVFQYLL